MVKREETIHAKMKTFLGTETHLKTFGIKVKTAAIRRLHSYIN